MSNRYVYLLYPEKYWIRAEKIVNWAKDCYVNEELDGSLPSSLEESIDLLEDLGVATFDHKTLN